VADGHPTVSREYQGARTLVLGASGFIGRWVARALTGAGAVVHAGVRDPAGFGAIARDWEIEATVHRFDATDPLSVEAVVRTAAPDIAFNLAGYGVDRAERDEAVMRAVNRDLVRLVAEALVRHPAPAWHAQRLVHAGSALEYGRLDGIAREDRRGTPHTPYGESKLAGTDALRRVCLTSGLRAVIGRLFTVYGPGEHPGRLLPALLAAAQERAAVALSDGGASRDFAYVEDVAWALLALGVSAADPGECVNVATGRLHPVRGFVQAAADALGLTREQLRFGDLPARPDEMQIIGVDTDRLLALVGWHPPDDIARGVVATAEFEARRHGRSAVSRLFGG
jgi:nucleoside-diphosphate-sugar epimerase